MDRLNQDCKEEVNVAAKWLKDADCVLLCAGAGMSANDGYNVYVDEGDFKKNYGWINKKYGFRCVYDVMPTVFGAGPGYPKVPQEEVAGFWFNHMRNMRWRFPVNAGYETLSKITAKKDTFILTSNVDGCFERSGFNVDKIYTPQGDYQYYQCMTPCSRDSVWHTADLLNGLEWDGHALKRGTVPKCPRCGGRVFGNVRGSQHFLHTKYDLQQKRFIDWVKAVEASGKSLVVLEIGAGMSTPIVTRYPVEGIVRAVPNSKLIRVNLDHSDVPIDLEACGKALGIPSTWQSLGTILEAMKLPDQSLASAAKLHQVSLPRHSATARSRGYDWEALIVRLRG